MFVLGTVCLLALWSVKHGRGETIFDKPFGSDFSALYLTGRLLNDHPADRYSDLELQYDLYHRILPNRPASEWMPSAIAPYLTPLLRLLARTPYMTAYFVWLALTMALFVCGCRLLWSLREKLPSSEWSTFLLLAIAFEPFLIESWLAGQSSALAFLFVSLALVLHEKQATFATGVAFSLLAYKPHFFILLAPALVLGRQWRILAGLMAGGAALAVISLVAVGWDGCRAYVEMLTHLGNASTGRAFALPTGKFVDINQFVTTMVGGKTLWSLLSAALVGVVGFYLLGRIWLRFDSYRRRSQLLLIAGTLALTPVLNVYMGIYETVIALPAAFLLADQQFEADGEHRFNFRFLTLLAIIFVVPWIAIGLAQLFTPVLVLLGVFALSEANRGRRPRLSMGRHSSPESRSRAAGSSDDVPQNEDIDDEWGA